jgi:hypothetical protein
MAVTGLFVTSRVVVRVLNPTSPACRAHKRHQVRNRADSSQRKRSIIRQQLPLGINCQQIPCTDAVHTAQRQTMPCLDITSYRHAALHAALPIPTHAYKHTTEKKTTHGKCAGKNISAKGYSVSDTQLYIAHG